VAADQGEAEKVKVVVAAEEKDVKAMQQQTQAIADGAQAELAEAMPALQAAVDSLKALNKNDIVEIKSFPKPPPLVQMTMEAVCILKQEKPDWDTVRATAICRDRMLCTLSCTLQLSLCLSCRDTCYSVCRYVVHIAVARID
jgi:hypothetical protein